jgi:hypothetical protein
LQIQTSVPDEKTKTEIPAEENPAVLGYDAIKDETFKDTLKKLEQTIKDSEKSGAR